MVTYLATDSRLDKQGCLAYCPVVQPVSAFVRNETGTVQGLCNSDITRDSACVTINRTDSARVI